MQKLLNKAARLVLQVEPRTHAEDLMRELYWLNVPNMFRYVLITSLRRLKYGQTIAFISFANLFHDFNGLYKLRKIHIRVQWPKISSHGRNSYIYQSSWLYNSMELNGEYFPHVDKFKEAVKFRLFRDHDNGNI